MSKLSVMLAATVVALSSFASSAQAAFVQGTQGFADIGNPVVNAADINAATSFTLGTVQTNESRTGDFLKLAPRTLIADGPLTLGNPSLFTLIDDEFGVFQATSIVEVAASPLTRSFNVTGNFTGGTAFGPGSVAVPALAAVSFTQAGGPGGAISGSLSLTAAVPEPASMAMVGLGLASVGGLALRRRLAK